MTPENQPETCATCAYFEPAQNECRRFPPKVFLIPVRTVDTTGAALKPIGAFPSTAPAAWCGEHLERDR